MFHSMSLSDNNRNRFKNDRIEHDGHQWIFQLRSINHNLQGIREGIAISYEYDVTFPVIMMQYWKKSLKESV